MNPRVLLRSKSNLEVRPQNNTLDPLGLYSTSKYLMNTPMTLIWEYLSRPRHRHHPFMGKLFQLTDSPQAGPFLSVHCLTGFRLFWNDLGRGFCFLFFFGTKLWQSVTMLIGGIRYSVKANNQTYHNIEIATFTFITVRVSHNLHQMKSLMITGPFVILIGNTSKSQIGYLIDWLFFFYF